MRNAQESFCAGHLATEGTCKLADDWSYRVVHLYSIKHLQQPWPSKHHLIQQVFEELLEGVPYPGRGSYAAG